MKLKDCRTRNEIIRHCYISFQNIFFKLETEIGKQIELDMSPPIILKTNTNFRNININYLNYIMAENNRANI